MSQPTKPKIKLNIKRSNNGTLNASSYPKSNSSPPPIESVTSDFKLPAKPTLQQAQQLLRCFGRASVPLVYDAKKQEVIPGAARMTGLKSRGKYGKSVTSLGPYAIGRSVSEQVALKRLQANREAARVAASGEEIANRPVALQGAFAIRELVLLKEVELCMAMAVVGDVSVATPRRKTLKRKAAAVAASPRTTRSSAKRRKN